MLETATILDLESAERRGISDALGMAGFTNVGLRLHVEL